MEAPLTQRINGTLNLSPKFLPPPRKGGQNRNLGEEFKNNPKPIKEMDPFKGKTQIWEKFKDLESWNKEIFPQNPIPGIGPEKRLTNLGTHPGKG